jgi:hypothetical protein
MARWATHRTDEGSKALIAYAESLGFVHENIGGTIDSLLALGQIVVAVDWKAKGGTLTDKQSKLVARGFPVRFISTPDQLVALKAEVLGRDR